MTHPVALARCAAQPTLRSREMHSTIYHSHRISLDRISCKVFPPRMLFCSQRFHVNVINILLFERFADKSSCEILPGYVIILTANEWEQILDGILIQHTDGIEMASLLREMCVGGRPHPVTLSEIGVQSKIRLQERFIVSVIKHQSVHRLFSCGRQYFVTDSGKFVRRLLFQLAQNPVEQIVAVLTQVPNTIGHHTNVRFIVTFAVSTFNRCWFPSKIFTTQQWLANCILTLP